MSTIKTWFGYGWAQQPVTNRGWAFASSLCDALHRATGSRLGFLGLWKHIAWAKAGGREWHA